jgi:glutamate racemase
VSGGPVGVFDSGIGGLSVAREIRQALPAEDLLYFADTAYVPYGDRSTEWVRTRSLTVGRYLQERGAKALVVACNTASGAALEALREHLSVPVIGLEPAVKPAVRDSVTGRVGVMATTGTLRSDRYARLVTAHGGTATVIAQPCPGLADTVEEGILTGDELDRRLAPLIAPLRDANVDTVVLGCTHYVFIRDAIARALGPDVRLIDSGGAIARQTERILGDLSQLTPSGEGSLRILTTGPAPEVAAVVARIWGTPLPVDHVHVPGEEPIPTT